MLHYSGEHKLSYAQEGHCYIYKNIRIYCLDIFTKSLSTTSCWLTGQLWHKGRGKISLAPELEKLDVTADTRSETMCKL